MKKVKNIPWFIVLIILATFSSCLKEKTTAIDDGFLTVDQFNELFSEGKLANTPEDAAALVYIDKQGNVIDYETYSTKDAAYWRENASKYFIRLADYNQLTEDQFATIEYLKAIPFGEFGGMFLHDPYATPEKRMTNAEIQQLFEKTMGSQQQTLRDENERVLCSYGSSVCTGDIMYQWGWIWDYYSGCTTQASGASIFGHNSIVDQGCQFNPRLRDFHIRESWYPGMKDATGNTDNGGVRHVRAGTTWGWASDKHCTNYWHNRNINGNGPISGQISQFYSAEHGKPYFYHAKVSGNGRPTKYYCSLYVWELYEEILGIDLDPDEGEIVDPNDIGRAIVERSHFNDPNNFIFELCDY